MTSASSINEFKSQIDSVCRNRGGVYAGYSCKPVSWDDAQRGTVGGGLSCWGGNITDTRLYLKSGQPVFTVRSDNWNEKLGSVSADDIAVLVPSDSNNNSGQLKPTTLSDYLKNAGKYGKYANLQENLNLFDEGLDSKVSVRFQTTFLPVPTGEFGATEFCSEAYNYNTHSDTDPKNVLLLCTTQGTAVQADGSGAKKLYHHTVNNGIISRHYLEAEATRHSVGGEQKETDAEIISASNRGKATSSVIGVKGMGTRFNALMTIQVPMKQKNEHLTRGLAYGMNPSYLCTNNMFGGKAICLESFFSDEGQFIGDGDTTFNNFSGYHIGVNTKSRSFSARGISSAARVSKGSFVDKWDGLKLSDPKRDQTQHLTATIVLYNVVAGGVPTEADIISAIDDMENLYKSTRFNGKLGDSAFNFMKTELTVNNMNDIAKKTGVPNQTWNTFYKPIVNPRTFPVMEDCAVVPTHAKESDRFPCPTY